VRKRRLYWSGFTAEVSPINTLLIFKTYHCSGFVVGSAANQAYNGALLADEDDVIVVGVKLVFSLDLVLQEFH
jgi:hypothetical protein